MTDFAKANSKDIRGPDIFAVARTLRAKYGKLGVVGYCYGGWAAFQLGAEQGLVDCVAVAHPAMLTKAEIDGVVVPVQVHAPQYDPIFTAELKAYALQTFPKKEALQWSWNYYPGQAHGFAVAADPSQEPARKALELAKESTSAWLRRWLS